MSSINEAMNLTMEKLREMVDVNTVVGQPITIPDGTTLIPVSKVTFGFASGGTDGTNIRFGAGSGAGVTITPLAFVVIMVGGQAIVEWATCCVMAAAVTVPLRKYLKMN